MHKIDLKNYEIRTDMVVDLLDNNKDNYYVNNNVKVYWNKLEENNSIGKKKGNYLTLEFDDITDDDAKKNLSEVFMMEFNKMLDKIGFNKDFKTLIVGLGNDSSTPDALGPETIDNIIVTSHFFDMNIDVDKNLSNVCAISPGVTGETGIETSDYVLALVKKVNPNLVIVVDALASSSISRVNKTIQVTDSGISPGSGIGNKRKEISSDTIGIPVIAIGVPTVVDATIIVSDTINYMIKNYTFNKNFIKSKTSKFVKKQVNYLDKKIDLNNDDKKTLLGLVGLLNEEELKKLVFEVLTPIGYNLMVTPKEEDFVVKKLSEVISYAINHSIHNI